jgi:CubicO group peptidase (beta-lactamase class C family)
MKTRRDLAKVLLGALAVSIGYAGCGDETEGGASVAAAVTGDRAAVDGYFTAPTTFILKPGTVTSVSWRYTTTTPPASWTQPSFSPSGWSTGNPGFWFGGGVPGDRQRTPWPASASDLWLRTTFSISKTDVPNAVFWGRWDDSLEVYINGVLAISEPGWSAGYRSLGMTAAGRAALKGGSSNTIAVHVKDTGGDRYFDLGITSKAVLLSRPSSGFERTPALAAYSSAVRQFMIEHGIPAGVLAVMKKDQVVVKRGFGWSDKGFTRPLGADAVMRLASNDKVLTTGAIGRMIDTGTVDPATHQRITWDTPVFPILRAHGLTPLPGRTPDPRIDSITVRLLHDHESGVSELPSEDQFYADLGVAPGSATTMLDDVRWVYSMPLEFAPGSTSAYSSAGYMLLRYLVHAVKGDLLTYLRSQVFGPAGSTDVFIANERLADRDPREPGYLTLEAPHDRWIYLDNFTALATTAEAFVRYLRRYSFGNGALLIDPVTGAWSPGPEGNGGGIFFGAMAGTWTVSEQRRWDEVSFVVFFNIVGPYDGLVPQLEAITDSLPASAWGI